MFPLSVFQKTLEDEKKKKRESDPQDWSYRKL